MLSNSLAIAFGDMYVLYEKMNNFGRAISMLIRALSTPNFLQKLPLEGSASPNRYCPCAATESGIKILDLESKSVVVDLKVDLKQESEMAADGSAVTGGPTKNISFNKWLKKVWFLLFKNCYD